MNKLGHASFVSSNNLGGGPKMTSGFNAVNALHSGGLGQDFYGPTSNFGG